MKFPSYKTTAVASGIALALLLAVGAQAQDNDADSAELRAARADLDRAVQRVAELSRKLGHHEPVVIERRIDRRPVLGVVLSPDPAKGVLIAGVTPESGAAKAGLRSGDRIVSIDGKAVAGSDGASRAADARARLRDLDVKRAVALGYERDGHLASAKVTPQVGERILVLPGDPAMGAMRFGNDLHVVEGPDGEIEVSADRVDVEVLDRAHAMAERSGPASPAMREVMVRRGPGAAPEAHREMIRMIRSDDCKGDDCSLPLLADAFRWSGLNLATVDAQLGHYFGTDHGVLVLSIPRDMAGLRAGDVIQKIDGKAVNTPREAMTAMHTRAPGTQVAVGYLRDRKSATARITVPKPQPLRLPFAPPPPAPPAPPAPPQANAMPAPPAPPAAPRAAAMPAPPAPPAPPRADAMPAPPAPPAPAMRIPPADADAPPPPPPPPPPLAVNVV